MGVVIVSPLTGLCQENWPLSYVSPGGATYCTIGSGQYMLLSGRPVQTGQVPFKFKFTTGIECISYSLQDLKTLPTNFLFSTRYSETTNLFPISYSEQYFSFSIIVSWLQTMEPDWPKYFGKIERIYFRSNSWKFFQGCWKFTTFKEFCRVLETSKL